MAQFGVVVYLRHSCGFCAMATRLLDRKGMSWEEVDITAEPERREEMIQRSGRRTVPQIFIAGQAIGGYDELSALDRAGELDRLLAAAD